RDECLNQRTHSAHGPEERGICADVVKKPTEQINRLQSSLAAALTEEQAQLQAIQQRPPGWTAGKKAHAQWEQQVARRKTRIAQIALRLHRVGEIEEAAGGH